MEDWSFSKMEKECLGQIMSDNRRYKEFLLSLNGDGNGIIEQMDKIMRKMKFRGYNIKNQKWLYGYYLVNRGKHFVVEDEICTPDKTWEDFEVDPESVGQFVGEYEGEKIFEGDIVRTIETDGYRTVRIGKVVYDQYNCRFVVEVEKPYAQKIPITGEKQIDQLGMGAYCEFYYKYEVIGNVYS